MRKVLIALFLFAACTDAGNTAIEIPFALLASDESSTSSTGVCTISPQTQAGGLYKPSGTLELNPVLNPNASYELNLQVENFLSQQTLTDSLGNTVVGANENDFHMQKATINYIDIEGNLGLSGTFANSTAFISGTAETGGSQSAVAVSVDAVPVSEAQDWAQTFVSNPNGALGPGAIEDVVLEVQILGELGSGEQAASGLFHFPLTVCFNCGQLPFSTQDGGASGPQYPPACPSGSWPVAVGHGPCCAPQDFEVICAACGQAGEPCCGGPVTGTCSGTSTCDGMAPQGVEICASVPTDLTEVVTCKSM